MRLSYKQGQIESHTIMYILIGIGTVVILLFGIHAISRMSKQGSELATLRFKTALVSDVESSSTSYGSRQTNEYRLPSSFREICFVDLAHVNASDIAGHLLMRDSVASGVQMNIFLLGKDTFETVYAEHVLLAGYPYYACIQPSGRFTVTLRGRGNAALISPPPSVVYCTNAQEGGLCAGLDFILVLGSGYQLSCCEEYSLCCGAP